MVDCQNGKEIKVSSFWLCFDGNKYWLSSLDKVVGLGPWAIRVNWKAGKIYCEGELAVDASEALQA